MTEPIAVQALYSFKGSNNDELCFQKGDFITITQKDDGGWWEGTLGDVTGWFPVNYVREIKDPSIMQQLSNLQPDIQNLSIVYKDLLDSERAHVTELLGLLNNFLIPLEKSTILNTDEYKQLTGNFLEVLDTHQELLRLIETENQKPHKDQRIGKIFLNYAPRMKIVHQSYRSLHPKAVCILDKYREELMKYMESCGANCPGVLVLTTGLSKPFRRLAKYSGMLLEVERHVEDCHPDRGDIQRSVAVYKEMEASCEATRRQKEIELQIITGPVRGWEGQSLATLGDIIYMGSVAVGPQHLDRYLILFPSTLLILSLSHRLSGFIYEGKLPVTGINVIKLEDSDQYKNGFEISGPMIEKFVAVCQSREEANHWVEILGKSNPNRTNSITNKALPSKVEIVPQPPPHLNERGYCNRMSVISYKPSYDYIPTLPCQYYPPAAPYAGLTKIYAQMTKQKIINKKLLKLLLYPETTKINVASLNVKRRQHRSECFIMRKGSKNRHSMLEASDSDSEECEESTSEDSTSCNLSRQNAIDHSTTSFGYIRYYNPESGTMIDHEEKYEKYRSPTKVVQPETKKPSIVLTSSAKLELMLPSDVSNTSSLYFITNGVPDTDTDDIEIDNDAEQTQEVEKVNNNKLLQQISQESDISSNVVPNYACENLAILNENFHIEHKGCPSEDYLQPKVRSSCPNKLVADRFNHSSLTTLYIPQSSSDNNLAWKCKVSESSTSSSTTTHSSSIDIPAKVLPIPDAMLAELLYNTDEIEEDNNTPIKPPTLFRSDEQSSPGFKKKSFYKTNIGFRKHSINSDKIYKRRSSVGDWSSNCPSVRSTDSGMAGSCTLNSPEFPLHDLNDTAREKVNSVLSDTFEAQCRCTSPFGSTPRTSAIQVTLESTRSSITSEELPPVPPPWESVDQIHKKLSGMRSGSFLQSSKSMSDLVTPPLRGDVFRSGLYAHWWLKADLPVEVVRGIYEDSRKKTEDAVRGDHKRQPAARRQN